VVLASSAVAVVGISFYAVAFLADHKVDTPETQEMPTNVLVALMSGYFACTFLPVLFAKGYALPLAGVAAFLAWLNFGVFFVALMAVSGSWL
jgi:hypothetical protein